MGLSVCCLAGAPGPRVKALVEPLREVADEIVIAADMRADAATLAEYASVADRLFRVEFVYLERHFSWLHDQCSGDWVFRIDADEIASPALIQVLPTLMEDVHVRQYLLPRRWLYSDPARWLDEPPWWPDYQLRLYRKDCFLRFSGLIHTSAVSQPPSGYLEFPLYHLDLVVNSLEQREQKVAFYNELRPVMEAPGGGAINERYYLPERAESLELAAVPAEDRPAIARVLGATAKHGASEAPELPVISASELDRWLEGSEFDPTVHRGRIEPTEITIRMMPREQRVIHFRVTNTGAAPWHWYNPEIHEGRQVRLSYHWFNVDGSVYEFDGLRTWLPSRLDPGDSTVVPLMVFAPSEPGSYFLEVDLVHERWFGCAIRLSVPIEPREEASVAVS
jgi:hypothetical protein